ncbi:MAG TPA: glycogen synthase [Mycobacteriales bacterium]|nr:glycogen synthase [Mycobacteriales bacterium]
MRVGLLTREYPPEVYGGAGVHVEYLARELAGLLDVDVHCFGEPRDDPLVTRTYQPWDQITNSSPHSAALRTLSVDIAMAGHLGGVDVVHSHTWYANFAGHLAAMTYGVPHVVTTHSLEPLRPWKAEQLGGGYAVSKFCERTAVEGADAVIAVSAGMRDDVIACYPGVDPARVRVVHNGVDTAEYTPDLRTDVVRRLGLDPDRPVVVFVGRIARQKGIVHLLDAAELLHPAAQLVLCAGSPDTPEIGAEVRERIAGLSARGHSVTWISEMLPRPQLIQLLSNAVAFVCPSIYEPFGLVNVEAMACGAAVVASRVGGIPEIVVDGQTGYLVDFEPSDDAYGTPAEPATYAAALAQRVNALVDDPALARAMGEAGRARAIAEFSWPSIAAQTLEVYRALGRSDGTSRL